MPRSSHSFYDVSEGFGSTKQPVSLELKEKVDSDWDDSVGKDVTDSFNHEYSKISDNMLKAFKALKDCDEKFPSVSANNVYESRAFEIGLLQVK